MVSLRLHSVLLVLVVLRYSHHFSSGLDKPDTMVVELVQGSHYSQQSVVALWAKTHHQNHEDLKSWSSLALRFPISRQTRHLLSLSLLAFCL
jgi:hypothetical protein